MRPRVPDLNHIDRRATGLWMVLLARALILSIRTMHERMRWQSCNSGNTKITTRGENCRERSLICTCFKLYGASVTVTGIETLFP